MRRGQSAVLVSDNLMPVMQNQRKRSFDRDLPEQVDGFVGVGGDRPQRQISIEIGNK
jgi:hypothetical protein